MAMMIVSLIATLAAGMMWQQWRAVQVEIAERARSQAEWILVGALDWARLLLREDARDGKSTSLLSPWATPLKEARLTTFLAADRDHVSEDAPDAFLSGQIRDAQARYNLRNVVVAGKVVAAELATLKRLCDLVGQPPEVADQLAEALRLAQPGTSADLAAADSAQRQPPLLPERIEDLAWLGLSPAAVQALQPHLVLLPRATPINLNTASRVVIAAVLPGVDLASAERLVQQRQRGAFNRPESARPLLPGGITLDSARVATLSNFFEVTGRIRSEDLVVTQRSLVERSANLEVRTLQSWRVPPDVAGLDVTD
jgi:general secretion pathway protein K